ncbi:MAG: zf-HC2 domain-containing protein [Phycisphaerae bacterium]
MSELHRDELGELLSAYIDGELPAAEAIRVERLLEQDESARRLMQELRQTATLVASLPRHDAPNSIAEDVRARIERSELLGDPDSLPIAAKRRQLGVPGVAAMAAMLALVVLGGLWISQRGWEPDAPEPVRLAMTHPQEKEAPVSIQSGRNGHSMGEGTPREAADESTGTSVARTRRMRKSGVKRRAARTSATEAPRSKVAELPSNKLLSGKRRQRGKRAEGKGVLALAPIEQKITAGIDCDKLQEHRFANEPVQLRVTMRDETKSEKITTKIIEYLKRRQLAEITVDKETGSVHHRLTGGFFFQGQPGVNFDDARQRQLLVRVPSRDLDGLLAQLTDDAGEKANVTLISGPVAVNGVDEARRMLRVADASAVHAQAFRRAGTADKKQHPPKPSEEDTKRSAARGRALTEVLSTLGLDLSEERRSQGARAGADAEQSTASEASPTVPAGGKSPTTASVRRGDRAATAHPAMTPSDRPTPLSKRRRSLVESLWEEAQTASQRDGRIHTPAARPTDKDELQPPGGEATRPRPTGTAGAAPGDDYVALVIELIVAERGESAPADEPPDAAANPSSNGHPPRSPGRSEAPGAGATTQPDKDSPQSPLK